MSDCEELVLVEGREGGGGGGGPPEERDRSLCEQQPYLYIQMWRACAEIKEHSVVCFDHMAVFEVPYH